jgi:hypothetical protein
MIDTHLALLCAFVGARFSASLFLTIYQNNKTNSGKYIVLRYT